MCLFHLCWYEVFVSPSLVWSVCFTFTGMMCLFHLHWYDLFVSPLLVWCVCFNTCGMKKWCVFFFLTLTYMSMWIDEWIAWWIAGCVSVHGSGCDDAVHSQWTQTSPWCPGGRPDCSTKNTQQESRICLDFVYWSKWTKVSVVCSWCILSLSLSLSLSLYLYLCCKVLYSNSVCVCVHACVRACVCVLL